MASLRFLIAISSGGDWNAEGFGLALRWSQAGETVDHRVARRSRPQQAADKIKQRVRDTPTSQRMETMRPRRGASDLIVLTIPFEVHAATLKQLKPAIRPGSGVVDTTVPLAASIGRRATRALGVWQCSAAQQAAEILGKEIQVVAAFHPSAPELLPRQKGQSTVTSSFAVTILARNPNRPRLATKCPAIALFEAPNWKTPTSSNQSPPC